MASKSKRLGQNTEIQNKTIQRIGYLSIFTFLIKLLIIWRISNITISQVQGHIWLGADGENYLKGVDSLISDGLFSRADILNYWPAGYPILIYLFSFFGKTWALTLLSIFQSFIFSFSVYILAKELFLSRLRKFTLLIFILITFNPTLSLNSMAVGYESLSAAGFILIFALIIRDLRNRNRISAILALSISSIILAILSFMQPRFLLTAILIISIWAFSRWNWKKAMAVFVIGSFIVGISPISLIYRNHVATGLNVISTNLGVTMNIGAGETTGGYINNPPGVPCEISATRKDQVDNQKVKCVLRWYLENPVKTLKLFYNKTIYFWSPWFGPEANGTMARNPWLTIHPFKSMTKTQEGVSLLYGTFGKLISWIWLLVGIFLVLYGFAFLWKQKGEIRILAALAISIILGSWSVTLISIGDHRFRLPIMGMSLLLQAVAIRALFSNRKSPMVQPLTLR